MKTINADDEAVHATMDLADEDDTDAPFDASPEIIYSDIRKQKPTATIVPMFEGTESFVSEKAQNEMLTVSMSFIIRLLGMIYGKASGLKDTSTLGSKLSDIIKANVVYLKDDISNILKTTNEKELLKKLDSITER